MRKFLGLLSMLSLVALARAGDPVPSAIDTAFASATTLFGVFVVLAVSVTGFFVGRRWLKRVG